MLNQALKKLNSRKLLQLTASRMNKSNRVHHNLMFQRDFIRAITPKIRLNQIGLRSSKTSKSRL